MLDPRDLAPNRRYSALSRPISNYRVQGRPGIIANNYHPHWLGVGAKYSNHDNPEGLVPPAVYHAASAIRLTGPLTFTLIFRHPLQRGVAQDTYLIIDLPP
jgi:hypothetical protein